MGRLRSALFLPCAAAENTEYKVIHRDLLCYSLLPIYTTTYPTARLIAFKGELHVVYQHRYGLLGTPLVCVGC